MLHTEFREKSACRFWSRRFLSGFYYIWARRPSWSCDLNFAITLSFPLLHIKFQFDLSSGFREEDL